MVTGVVEESVIGRSGEEASPPISPSMEGVLPIRGVDADTGEEVAIPTAGLREAEDPYRVDVVRWTALDVPSIMVAEDMKLLRDAYRIPFDIELLLPDPNERACFPRMGYTVLSLNAFVSGMRLSLHPFFRRILRAYGLAPIQVSPNGWGKMVGGLYLWFRHSFRMEMPLHVFQTMYQPRKLPKKKNKDEEPGWYYLCLWGSHKPLVIESPSSVKQLKESWFWVTGNWQRVDDDPEPDLDVPSVYGIANALPRCELSREIVEVLRPALARLSKQKPRALTAGSSEEVRQKKVLEDLSREDNKKAVEASKVIEVDDSSAPEGDVSLSRKRKSRAPGTGAPQGSVEIVDDYATCSALPLQRTLAVNTSREVVLEGPSRLSQKSGGTEGGPYESKRRLRELIGAPGARILDDVLRNVPFYPSMGAQAVKKYFTPKWK
ncbi:Plus3 domain-containing protein [Abeliophyllum distichum]|uniref:Plus3 domain-containing protein n=1 Tax=Abeliophyllum distichum TaxID=126358 RepID=A0ABD1SCU8_9LAMI